MHAISSFFESIHLVPRAMAWGDSPAAHATLQVPTMHQTILSRAGRDAGIIESGRLRFVRSSSSSLAPQVMAELDEQFHFELLRLAGNREAARIHQEVCERIRIVRRLDFYQAQRIEKTYEEHADILKAIAARRRDEASRLLRAHIEHSRQEVHKISLSMLEAARRSYRAG